VPGLRRDYDTMGECFVSFRLEKISCAAGAFSGLPRELGTRDTIETLYSGSQLQPTDRALTLNGKVSRSRGIRRRPRTPFPPGHEVPSEQSVSVRLGSHAHYLEYRSFKLNMCQSGPLASTGGVSFVVPNCRGDVRSWPIARRMSAFDP
jgi:hypothetical protein